MKWVKLFISSVITLGLFYVLHFPLNENIPFAVGKFFNPFGGFWQNNLHNPEQLTDRELPGLQAAVTIVWDDREIPHIFAENAADLYFVQGYLTARARLWQMDFITRAAAGRLSEVLGNKPGLIEFDRFKRRIGMVYAAENALKKMQEDEESRIAVESYSRGVNVWISGLAPKDYPLEYKIFNYSPEAWTPLKSALMLKAMAWDLTGFNEELIMTRTRAALGDSLMETLFFRKPFLLEPIIPRDTAWPFEPIVSPHAPDSLFKAEPLAEKIFRRSPAGKDAGAEVKGELLSVQSPYPDPGNGSNNWVVAGSKTESGYPILCNDPHLRLNLPSIWYEVQLVSPEVNVYGVSLPGAPCVIIGFNRDVAWGVTNGGTDVMDWYQIQFKKDNPWAYLYDGKWLAADPRLETINVLGEATIVDTIPLTRYGLVAYRNHEKPFNRDIPAGCALRWTAHDPSNEVAAFLKLNRAKNYDDYQEALLFYDCPAQNFVFADNENNIAIQHTGKFPIRWPRQGRYISDGSDPAYDWQGWIPRNHLPKIKNPGRGYIASANQNPAGARYPYYMSGRYEAFERSARIHEALSASDKFTARDMMKLQTDNLNLFAKTVLPTITSILEWEDIGLAEASDLELLKNWDFINHRDAPEPIFFEYLWDNVTKLIWADEMLADTVNHLKIPRRDVTMELILHDSSSAHFDIKSTENIREDRNEILLLALRSAHEQLYSQLGAPGDNWNWGKSRGTDILHLARIRGLGRIDLETDGNHDIVNAIKKDHGPSWRMIVELGPEPQAWGIYPGGQSGNPGSTRYDQFLDDWVNGQYYQLLFLQSPDDSNPRLTGKTILRGLQ